MDNQDNFAFTVVGDIEKPAIEDSSKDTQLYGTTSMQCEPPVY